MGQGADTPAPQITAQGAEQEPQAGRGTLVQNSPPVTQNLLYKIREARGTGPGCDSSTQRASETISKVSLGTMEQYSTLVSITGELYMSLTLPSSHTQPSAQLTQEVARLKV